MFLSFDVGTSSLKLSVLDKNMRILHSESEAYPYIIKPGEKVEMDTDAILKALTNACSRLPATLREKIEIICYDTYSPSLVLMDENGSALYPVVTHMDRRSRKQSQFICECFGKDRFLNIVGAYPFTGGVSLTSLLWFIQEEPSLISKVRRIGHLATYMYKKLTGVWAVDSVNASMMGLYCTVKQSSWSDEILQAFQIPKAWLSDIHTPGTILGKLQSEMASAMGLAAGIPVCLGTNDMAAAQVGAGNTSSGQILDTAGSSDMVSILTDKPVTDPVYYLRNAATPGLWQIYATTSGGFALDWFRKEFCREADKKEFYDSLIPAAISLIDGNPVTFDPYLAEDRQSLERKTAAWHGLTLSSTREQMLAALLYGMQKVLSDMVMHVSKFTNIDKQIKVTGGMADEHIIKLKQKMLPGYTFKFQNDCTIYGNAALASQALQ
jgi:sugar (pentulose or hexulose) kinase